MNDFTKDDLMLIAMLALQNINQYRQNSECIELLNKVRSMIDNYNYKGKEDE